MQQTNRLHLRPKAATQYQVRRKSNSMQRTWMVLCGEVHTGSSNLKGPYGQGRILVGCWSVICFKWIYDDKQDRPKNFNSLGPNYLSNRDEKLLFSYKQISMKQLVFQLLTSARIKPDDLTLPPLIVFCVCYFRALVQQVWACCVNPLFTVRRS